MLTLGCATPHTQVRRSSLMGYLYPKASEAPKPDPAGASLQLPLKLGIVFVPGGTADWRNDAVVAADAERPLLDTVRGAFKERPWVGDIKIIPSAYLRAGGGFENLDQASRMFGVDVIALVSVDQIQQTDPKWYSFTYLSILGAFVVPAERNSTRTTSMPRCSMSPPGPFCCGPRARVSSRGVPPWWPRRNCCVGMLAKA